MPNRKSQAFARVFRRFGAAKQNEFSQCAATEQFRVDFRNLRDLVKELRVCGDAGAGLPPLLRRLEQELPRPVNPEALDEIGERPVLPPLAVTAAVLFAAGQILLDARCSNEVRWD